MEKVKPPLPKDHTAIVFDYGEERNRRKKAKAQEKDPYKPEFSKFRKILEQTTKDDKNV